MESKIFNTLKINKKKNTHTQSYRYREQAAGLPKGRGHGGGAM